MVLQVRGKIPSHFIFQYDIALIAITLLQFPVALVYVYPVYSSISCKKYDD